MHLKHIITALAVFGSLAASAPAQDAKAAGKGVQNQGQDQKQNQNNGNGNGNSNNNNNNNRNNKGQNQNQNQNKGNNNKNGDVTIVQNIIKPNIIVVQENLDKINQLQRQNERELAALVQSQLALATQLQAVKDNIRINHFKAQFPQANTIIVTVTGLVDNRNQGQQRMRYLVNQLLADNGQPGKQTLVMVTDPSPLQISTQQAASSQSNAFGAARVALGDSAADSTGPQASDGSVKASAVTGADDATLKLAAFDQAAPFGQVGQSIILPAGTQAPQLSLSVPDPAAIILPNQQGLFVENTATFLSDCASSAANVANGNPALAGAAATIFSSFQQIAAAQLAGLSGLGIFNNSGQGLAGQPLGAIAVGANQGQPPPPPAAAAPPPAQAEKPPPAGAALQANPASILAGANQAQPAAAQPPSDAAAPPPAAAIIAGANQAQPAAALSPPQGSSGSGVVIVGSSPGGTAAKEPAAQPPAAVIAGANQEQTAGQTRPGSVAAPAQAAAIVNGANQGPPAVPPVRST
ncbi:hypothetical protein CSOJ01_04070 [Colletotrichum sojae]|uniref:Cas1p-like protein n=1 Tax=Colletotrichum sojae TaxID=2175907 RepID=A0A8H6JJK2_9PEZI|nr:hypothetical protein CSOJ01_04070 [Colletotrichum sojae]